MNKDVLYYPHISFTDARLIKGLSLFYENIYRIVPEGATLKDNMELAALIEEGKTGIAINPARYSQKSSDLFLKKLEKWDAAALSPCEGDIDITNLHVDKTDEKVRLLFKEAGFEENGGWMSVPTALASNYMLFLAQHISVENELNMATPDWGAWTANNYFALNGAVDDFVMSCDDGYEELEDPYALFSLVIDELVPLNLCEIPANKIVEFRYKRKDEIANLRDCIFDLQKSLQGADSPEVQSRIIKDKINALEVAQNEYRGSADIINAGAIWGGFTMIAFPAALSVGLSLSPLFSMGVCGSSILFKGLHTIKSTKEDIRKLRLQNSASALVALNRKFKNYTSERGGGDAAFHAYNCMEEYVAD